MTNFVCFTVACVLFGVIAALGEGWQFRLLNAGLFAFVFAFWLNAINAL